MHEILDPVSGKNTKNILVCRLLKISPRVVKVKDQNTILETLTDEQINMTGLFIYFYHTFRKYANHLPGLWNYQVLF